jgi:hypothetical protein
MSFRALVLLFKWKWCILLKRTADDTVTKLISLRGLYEYISYLIGNMLHVHHEYKLVHNK